MTNKEAKATLEVYQEEILNTLWLSNEQRKGLDEALTLAIKALEIVHDVNQKIYRNENCDRKRTCYDYIGYHCAGCNGAKESENE